MKVKFTARDTAAKTATHTLPFFALNRDNKREVFNLPSPRASLASRLSNNSRGLVFSFGGDYEEITSLKQFATDSSLLQGALVCAFVRHQQSRDEGAHELRRPANPLPWFIAGLSYDTATNSVGLELAARTPQPDNSIATGAVSLAATLVRHHQQTDLTASLYCLDASRNSHRTPERKFALRNLIRLFRTPASVPALLYLGLTRLQPGDIISLAIDHAGSKFSFDLEIQNCTSFHEPQNSAEGALARHANFAAA